MASQQKFEGWVGLDKDSAEGKLVWQAYDPKTFEETDIDIEISHCGICGSDLHALRSGWGPTDYPIVVGHEIVGKAIRVGKNVDKKISVGDRVGVGAQSGSCLRNSCRECTHDYEQYCQNGQTTTYGGKWPSGEKAQGGYAKFWRGNGHFVFNIPEGLASEDAAPMLCGGVTTYSPLKMGGCGPGKRVGIIGIGGLGHFGLLWAKALGADKLVAISRGTSKKEDAKKLGADDFIATQEEGWETKNASSLDLIVSTVSGANIPIMKYLQLLDVGGRFIQVGAPEDPFPQFHPFALIAKRVSVEGSAIGSPKEIEEMLQLAADKKIKPWIQEMPMKDANKAIVQFEEGKPRYRYVLKN
ncbi:uncharacterized protein LTR77_011074 [Saxophila tyrrhenica]|uniref:alcohol dehydrogenase (NADP(+)) n=1 Tax=Saxophila tyrrhenica TaxID=1690608 RepID=A0AAV9NV83_9PEZI|nr:hypothetical protein LTR77_011074 [Saxophila tyrrhenica]